MSTSQNTPFHQDLSQEVYAPAPGGKGFLHLRKKLRKIYRAFGRFWSKKQPKKLSPEFARFMRRVERDELNFEIARLLDRYRTQRLSTGVTKKAANRVLNSVRRAYVKEVARRMRAKSFEEVEKHLKNDPLYSTQIEEKVDDLEVLYANGDIEKVEYYFLLATAQGYRPGQTAEFIDWKPTWGHTCLYEARKKVKEAMVREKQGVLEKPTRKKGNRRKVDEFLLNNAIRVVGTE